MNLIAVTCPSCFEVFEIVAPPLSEVPTELDYDCEICCRPMVIDVQGETNELWIEARGISA